MRLSDYDYTLPDELIAQDPSPVRGDDRLLVIDRAAQNISEKRFNDITDHFNKGDLLVLNDTKVLPARLFGKRATGGSVEIFVVDRTKRPAECLVRPSGKIKDGERVVLESGDEVIVHGRTAIGRLVEFLGDIDMITKRAGHMPLPPYITREDKESDKERYQTVFARNSGATASPTAGLHLTPALIEKLKQKGVQIAYVTLHVSYGTFAPVKTDDITRHTMHSEYFHIDKDTVPVINKARNEQRRIIACGTTTVRVLESCADDIVNYIDQGYSAGGNHFDPSTGSGSNSMRTGGFDGFDGFTSLFIYPGYTFRIVNAMITNFHLPRSSLLLLTGAFCGKDLLFNAYRYAVDNKFRFFSYGDAMFIV